MTHERLEDLKRFYLLLDRLSRRVGGLRRMSDCNGRMLWPSRGVYFFFEDGESRTDSGVGGRVVRVGTHALRPRSKTSLWKRLSQHRGTRRSGGGNHRGSVFRRHVGTALSGRDLSLQCGSWAQGRSTSAAVRGAEQALESIVTQTIGKMPLLWLDINDKPGPESERSYVEQNAIGLLSNFNKPSHDPASPRWLGQHCRSERVRGSGLWNSDYVDVEYDDGFLNRFENLVGCEV